MINKQNESKSLNIPTSSNLSSKIQAYSCYDTFENAHKLVPQNPLNFLNFLAGRVLYTIFGKYFSYNTFLNQVSVD
jgi:hypothetical protein